MALGGVATFTGIAGLVANVVFIDFTKDVVGVAVGGVTFLIVFVDVLFIVV